MFLGKYRKFGIYSERCYPVVARVKELPNVFSAKFHSMSTRTTVSRNLLRVTAQHLGLLKATSIDEKANALTNGPLACCISETSNTSLH